MFTPRKHLASDEYEKNRPWSKLDIDKPVRFVIPTNAEVGRPLFGFLSLLNEQTALETGRAYRCGLVMYYVL